jgi:hypothetical protein
VFNCDDDDLRLTDRHRYKSGRKENIQNCSVDSIFHSTPGSFSFDRSCNPYNALSPPPSWQIFHSRDFRVFDRESVNPRL